MNKAKLVRSLEFFSIIGFGLAYWKFDLQVATITLMALMTLFILSAKLLREPLNGLQMGTWFVVMILGSLTLLFDNDQVIKWKTTIINGVLALVFAGSHLFGQRTVAERLLMSRIKAPVRMLRNLNGAAVLYFLLIGSLNLMFAYYFTTTAWVNFKLFGSLALNLIFVAGSMYYLRDYLKDLMEQSGKK